MEAAINRVAHDLDRVDNPLVSLLLRDSLGIEYMNYFQVS